MVLNKFLNKAYRNVNITFKSFNNLKTLTKLFIIFLILLFMTCIFNSLNNENELRLMENFTQIEFTKDYEKKKDEDIYDDFYSKYYNDIFLNKKRHEKEFEYITSLSKKNSNTKILDVGCGTGYTTKLFNEKKYDITGLDKSESMIKVAESNYPKCEFMVNDILNNNILDYDSFSHIVCLGKTIYEIKDKERFFENCFSLLSVGGFLIIHLVDRNKFKPYVYNKDKNTLYDPEKYGKKIDELIIKFDNKSEFTSKYNIKNTPLNNEVDDNITPHSSYNEKFMYYDKSNKNRNKIKEYERNLYMPDTSKILNCAQSKNFKLHKKFKLEEVEYNNEYLYVFKKKMD